MTDDEIVAALRSESKRLTPVGLADLLDTLTDGGLSQGTLVTYFKRAFPEVPLRVLLEAGAWNRLSGGELTDTAFNDSLRPWLKGAETLRD
jgi:hypothetical protein